MLWRGEGQVIKSKGADNQYGFPEGDSVDSRFQLMK